MKPLKKNSESIFQKHPQHKKKPKKGRKNIRKVHRYRCYCSHSNSIDVFDNKSRQLIFVAFREWIKSSGFFLIRVEDASWTCHNSPGRCVKRLIVLISSLGFVCFPRYKKTWDFLNYHKANGIIDSWRKSGWR